MEDDRSVDARVRHIAAELHGRHLSCAESCTGGLLAQSFAAAEGSADWFPGGIVTYQTRAKVELLDVTPGCVVSARTAEEMARGVAALFDASVAVSITCAAGPDPLDGAPPGTLFVGTMVGGEVRSHRHLLHGTPTEICCQARRLALADLLSRLTADA
jgi:nicotinamide-nucleotide amidase